MAATGVETQLKAVVLAGAAVGTQSRAASHEKVSSVRDETVGAVSACDGERDTAVRVAHR